MIEVIKAKKCSVCRKVLRSHNNSNLCSHHLRMQLAQRRRRCKKKELVQAEWLDYAEDRYNETFDLKSIIFVSFFLFFFSPIICLVMIFLFLSKRWLWQ